MGNIEVKGTAQRTVPYDLMKISIKFSVKEKTSVEASKKAMQSCEDILKVLKKAGMDISKLSLGADSVTVDYNRPVGDTVIETYRAEREINFITDFNMKLLNDIRNIINGMETGVIFNTDYMLSNEDDIKKELFVEALKNAKVQAELLSDAIGQKVVGLVSADKNERNDGFLRGAEVLCCGAGSNLLDLESCYEASDELAPREVKVTEYIYTVWEIQ